MLVFEQREGQCIKNSDRRSLSLKCTCAASCSLTEAFFLFLVVCLFDFFIHFIKKKETTENFCTQCIKNAIFYLIRDYICKMDFIHTVIHCA